MRAFEFMDGDEGIDFIKFMLDKTWEVTKQIAAEEKQKEEEIKHQQQLKQKALVKRAKRINCCISNGSI